MIQTTSEQLGGSVRDLLPSSLILLLILTVVEANGQSSSDAQVSFSRQVLPLLSNKCLRCHGPDENTREAGLRLDLRETAIDFGAIAPGESDSSEMVARIESIEEGHQMPPAESGIEALSKSEIALFRKWIDQGANWEMHWSFVTPTRPDLPTVENDAWVRNPIDRFVLAKLNSNGLAPSQRANDSSLIRRLSLLMTGLPPTKGLLERLQGQEFSQANYEQAVDELLDSEAFGEHMAAGWLNVARYSDTDGFQQDEPRTNWPWRDWVIGAYNANMRFDQFTIEQFAGDLLPNATQKQILATCFHRNHMTNGEGGRDPNESRVDYVLDRVNTMGTAWLGLTLGCAQCHTHKYDPITQKEYYQFAAFFNSIDEDGRAGRNAKPYLKWPVKSEQASLAGPRLEYQRRQKKLARMIDQSEQRFETWMAEKLKSRQLLLKTVLESNWSVFKAETASSSDETVELKQNGEGIWRVEKGNPNNDSYVLRGKASQLKVGSIRIEVLPHESFTFGGLSRSNSGNFVLTNVVIEVLRPVRGGKEIQRHKLRLADAWADYSQPGFDVSKAIDSEVDTGWAVWSGDMKEPRTAVFHLAKPVELQAGDQLEIQLDHFSHHVRHNIGRFRVSLSPLVAATHETGLTKILAGLDSDLKPNPQQRKQLFDYFIAHDGKLGLENALLNRAKRALEGARTQNEVRVMVLKERPKSRQTFVLERGVWDAHGEEVFCQTPEALLPRIAETKSAETKPDYSNYNRLDLAKWLVHPDNPLTARVTVNRYWQMYFGAGLVRTPEDFGLQGEQPTHPELLDWLACEFVDSGWNIKHIHRLITTSSTFQQSSVHRRGLALVDPENRLLARGPRFRMPAAMIRDNALAVAGLLSRKVGGPSVKPYQPENVWSASDQGKYPYELSAGEDLYRRSIYTYWRRNISPPGMFDAAQRRVCEVAVRRTNSPMHALTLLNDITYLEAARNLAETLIKRELDDRALIQNLFQAVLMRDADDSELDRLMASLVELRKVYSAQHQEAGKLLSHGDRKADDKLDPANLAALTLVASTVLNLDETLNIE